MLNDFTFHWQESMSRATMLPTLLTTTWSPPSATTLGGALTPPIQWQWARLSHVGRPLKTTRPPNSKKDQPAHPLNTRLISAHPQLLPLAQLSGMAVTPCWATLLTIGISGSTANHPSSQIHRGCGLFGSPGKPREPGSASTCAGPQSQSENEQRQRDGGTACSTFPLPAC